DSQISGVNTPYLYLGMWRATLAWDVEDMYLFSINYIHFSTANWYATPQYWASNLETIMKGYFVHDISTCPQFLHHISFLTSPRNLDPVCPNRLIQHAGEFVVTFSHWLQSWFNCAESINL
ncbi:JmjC domain-containing protein, partial [Hysterangium stoloniferum]